MRLLISKLANASSKICKYPFWLIFNFFTLILQNVKYQNFPKIDGFIVIKNRGRINLRRNVVISSSSLSNPVGNRGKTIFMCSPNGKIDIGNNVSISNTLIFSQECVTIEDNVMIGGGVQIWDTDFHPLDLHDRIIHNISEIKKEPVLLKNGCFIGANSIILKGVTIGEKSIIGAGSVVSKNIPSNEIWAGNPARYIKSL